MNGPHGWLVVDKPAGLTSAQVVARIKGALRRAGYGQAKVGHGGTLDPLATGVLPVALGEATKLSGFVLNGRKAYRFSIRFGVATATDDAEGEVTATSAMQPTRAQVEAVLGRFTGPILQRPPVFSALKIAGARSYRLARQGVAVELEARAITIDALRLAAWREGEADFEVEASKGTYVRALARDIAQACGTVGHVGMLRRTGAGGLGIADAISLDLCLELVQGGRIEQALLPLTAGLDDIPALAVEREEAIALKQGRRIPGSRAIPGLYVATFGSVPVALVEAMAGDIRVVRGLNI
jgi:tRNA pseudouridine55 synthase